MRLRVPRVPGAAVALLVLAIAVLPVWPIPHWNLLPHITFAILAAGAVALCATYPPWPLGSAALRRIGQVSYSLYLIHFAVLAVSLRLAEWLLPAADWRTMLLHFAFTFAASFAAACATYRLVERPAIRWAAGRTLPHRPDRQIRVQAATEAADRPAAQMLRDFVAGRCDSRTHDAWFRAEVEQAMREADDAAVVRLPHKEIAARWQRQLAALRRQIAQLPP